MSAAPPQPPNDAEVTCAIGEFGGSLAGRDLAPGDRIADWWIERVIAVGGFSTVYAAVDPSRDRRAAVKLLHAEAARSVSFVTRFLMESRIISQLRHPHIVEILEVGSLPNGRPYYVMELLAETNFKATLARHGRLAPSQALLYLEPVCDALTMAHQRGIVHRDLKAGNIAMGADSDPHSVKLLDFGIAKLLHPEPGEAGLTTAGQQLGTPHAMAPEQIRGGLIDPRTDVYALGVLLYQMLTGEIPFQAVDPRDMERLHLEAPAPRPSRIVAVTPAVDALVLRCLEKAPEQRFPSVLAFLEALRAAVAGGEGTRAGAHLAEAIAILVEVKTSDDADDVLLGDLAMILDTAEQELGAAGWRLLLQTGAVLLAVAVLPEASAEARRLGAAAVELAHALVAAVAVFTDDPRIQLVVGLHVDQAEVRSTAEGLVVAGGRIAGLREWGLEGSGTVRMTTAARALLGEGGAIGIS